MRSVQELLIIEAGMVARYSSVVPVSKELFIKEERKSILEEVPITHFPGERNLDYPMGQVSNFPVNL